MSIILIVGPAVVVTVLAVVFRSSIVAGYEEANRAAAPVRSRIVPMPAHYKDTLDRYFIYYQKLSTTNKARFERKVMEFLFRKRIIPRNVAEVTDEAKVLIAACAVQITFGLPNVYLEHFRLILLYPDDYYSSITKRFHKGEVNPRFGIIVLSWQNLVEGYLNPTNAINLGLHEMAHALRIENIIRNEEYHFFDEELLERFDKWAYKFCADMDNWKEGFFRPYACTNTHEFFSVSIENFFERPAVLRQELPEVYDILVKLLNQDPMTIAES